MDPFKSGHGCFLYPFTHFKKLYFVEEDYLSKPYINTHTHTGSDKCTCVPIFIQIKY